MLFLIIGLMILLWVIGGITAFVMSIICLGYNGSGSHKFIGFLIAFFFGPFYWFYYAYNSNYCIRDIPKMEY